MADRASVIVGQPNRHQSLVYHMRAVNSTYKWLTDHIQLVYARECDLSLDALLSLSSNQLLALVSVDASDPDIREIVQNITSHFRKWIGRWRAAAAEAATLGLGGDISCKYWQQNIQLPNVITMARKWFATVKRLVKADPSKLSGKLIKEGRDYVAAVTECHSSWPRARGLSIGRRVLKWNMLLGRWSDTLLLANGLDATKLGCTAICRVALIVAEKQRAAFRAIMLKKRTCSHCGRTGPLSQVSFAYCGGCRDSGVARVDWSRYCSETCQRAHWAAGHKDECPCAH